MGECLLARGAGGSGTSKDPLDDIPITAGYCTILLTLKDSAGGLCPNTKINCKDGTRWYNYTTNEAGMALFKCNSGSANFYCNNYINNQLVFDQAAVYKNYDAVVGTKFAQEIFLNRITNFNKISGTHNGIFKVTGKVTNVILLGGGGAGDSGAYGGTGSSLEIAGGGGGGGAKNYAASIAITKNQLYSITVGVGTSGAGGTTSAFGLSANGGSAASGNNGGRGGIGLYNGGNGANGWYHISGKTIAATTATAGINGAGGGGGGGGMIGDSDNRATAGKTNGGGNGGDWWNIANDGITGSGGGGGGGGSLSSNSYHSKGGIGGSGRVTFNMEL